MNLKTLTLLALAYLPCNVHAQHDMHNMGHDHKAKDTATHNMNMDDMGDMDMSNMDMSDHAAHGGMTSGQSINLPMSRDGSGTSWKPTASPMYAIMIHTPTWKFMVHGDIFIRYNKQDISNAGTRGGEKWDAPDMLMFMGQRKVGGKGLFQFNTMFSTDAIIAGGNGYPLLFQTGESWHGQPLIDRQHPHDLFAELSVSYAYALSKKSDLSLYVGYPGEPALGPVTFMHRPSGDFNPDAPIGHHWADATHITFGVATLGFRFGKFKLEGSSFTGREPDEDRYNFDKPLFDSWSGRLSFNPSDNWAMQVSHGFIKSPEAHSPMEDVNRTTASVTFVRPIAEQKYFAATALWGQNSIEGKDASNTVLLEATFRTKKLVVYSRYEFVQKDGEELFPYSWTTLPQYTANVVTLGAGYELFNIASITVAGGGQVSQYFIDKSIESVYGKNPVSGEVYLHFYPKLMKHEH